MKKSKAGSSSLQADESDDSFVFKSPPKKRKLLPVSPLSKRRKVADLSKSASHPKPPRKPPMNRSAPVPRKKKDKKADGISPYFKIDKKEKRGVVESSQETEEKRDNDPQKTAEVVVLDEFTGKEITESFESSETVEDSVAPINSVSGSHKESTATSKSSDESQDNRINLTDSGSQKDTEPNSLAVTGETDTVPTKPEEEEPTKEPSINLTPKSESFSCVLCFKIFDKSSTHISHMKQCAKKKKISTGELLKRIELAKTGGKLVKETAKTGGKPVKETAKSAKSLEKSKESESSYELALATAISLSLDTSAGPSSSKVDKRVAETQLATLEKFGFTTTRPNTGGRKRKVQRVGKTALETRTSEERARLLTEKAAVLLLTKQDSEEATQEKLTALRSGLSQVTSQFPFITQGKKLWDLGETETTQEWYVNELEPFMSPRKPEEKEAISTLVTTPQEDDTPPAPTAETSLEADWEKLVGNSNFSDASVETLDLTVPIHLLVLQVRCPNFCLKDLSEACQTISSSTFLDVMRFIYTGMWVKSKDCDVEDVLCLARLLGRRDLERMVRVDSSSRSEIISSKIEARMEEGGGFTKNNLSVSSDGIIPSTFSPKLDLDVQLTAENGMTPSRISPEGIKDDADEELTSPLKEDRTSGDNCMDVSSLVCDVESVKAEERQQSSKDRERNLALDTKDAGFSSPNQISPKVQADPMNDNEVNLSGERQKFVISPKAQNDAADAGQSELVDLTLEGSPNILEEERSYWAEMNPEDDEVLERSLEYAKIQTFIESQSQEQNDDAEMCEEDLREREKILSLSREPEEIDLFDDPNDVQVISTSLQIEKEQGPGKGKTAENTSRRCSFDETSTRSNSPAARGRAISTDDDIRIVSLPKKMPAEVICVSSDSEHNDNFDVSTDEDTTPDDVARCATKKTSLPTQAVSSSSSDTSTRVSIVPENPPSPLQSSTPVPKVDDVNHGVIPETPERDPQTPEDYFWQPPENDFNDYMDYGAQSPEITRLSPNDGTVRPQDGTLSPKSPSSPKRLELGLSSSPKRTKEGRSKSKSPVFDQDDPSERGVSPIADVLGPTESRLSPNVSQLSQNLLHLTCTTPSKITKTPLTAKTRSQRRNSRCRRSSVVHNRLEIARARRSLSMRRKSRQGSGLSATPKRHLDEDLLTTSVAEAFDETWESPTNKDPGVIPVRNPAQRRILQMPDSNAVTPSVVGRNFVEITPRLTPCTKIVEQPTPRPNFDGMRTGSLKKHLQKFGLKKSLSKLKAKKILNHFYDELHPIMNTKTGKFVKLLPAEASRGRKATRGGSRGGRGRGSTSVGGRKKNKDNGAGSIGGDDGATKGAEEEMPPVSSEGRKIDSGVDDGFVMISDSEESLTDSSIEGSEDEFCAAEDEVLTQQPRPAALPVEEAVQKFYKDHPDLYADILFYKPMWVEKLRADLQKYFSTKYKLVDIMTALDNQCITFRNETQVAATMRRNERAKTRRLNRKAAAGKKNKKENAASSLSQEETKRRQQAEAAERRLREAEGKGVKNPSKLHEKQRKLEEMEARAERDGGTGGGLKICDSDGTGKASTTTLGQSS